MISYIKTYSQLYVQDYVYYIVSQLGAYVNIVQRVVDMLKQKKKISDKAKILCNCFITAYASAFFFRVYPRDAGGRGQYDHA